MGTDAEAAGVYTVQYRYMDCNLTEYPGAKILVACAPSKQMPPFCP